MHVARCEHLALRHLLQVTTPLRPVWPNQLTGIAGWPARQLAGLLHSNSRLRYNRLYPVLRQKLVDAFQFASSKVGRLQLGATAQRRQKAGRRPQPQLAQRPRDHGQRVWLVQRQLACSQCMCARGC